MFILAAAGALAGALTRTTRALVLWLLALWCAMAAMLAIGALSAGASGARPASLAAALVASALFGGALIAVAAFMGRGCRLFVDRLRARRAGSPPR